MLSRPLTYTLWHAEKLPNHVIAHHVAVRLNKASDDTMVLPSEYLEVVITKR
jgi:hypothetical protein